jgi:hypothetical protein
MTSDIDNQDMTVDVHHEVSFFFASFFISSSQKGLLQKKREREKERERERK